MYHPAESDEMFFEVGIPNQLVCEVGVGQGFLGNAQLAPFWSNFLLWSRNSEVEDYLPALFHYDYRKKHEFSFLRYGTLGGVQEKV